MTVVQDAKIESVLRAIMNKRSLRISYTKNNGECSERTVIPLDFAHSANSKEWRVFGFCSLRKEFRSFRNDRISSIELTDSELNQYKTLKKGDESNMFVIMRESENSTPTGVILAKYNGTNIHGNLINSGIDKPATVLTASEAEKAFNNLIANGFFE